MRYLLRPLVAMLLGLAVAGLARGQLVEPQLQPATVKPRPATAPAPSATASPKSTAPILSLIDGGYVTGALEDTSDPAVLRWRSPSFAAPLEFTTEHVSAVRWPAPKDLPKATGEYCFELTGGDVLFGSLLGLDDKEAAIRAASLGEVRVRRSILRRIYRWRDGSDVLYLGPKGLSEWQSPSARGGWREEGGDLFTDTPGASITSDVGIPFRAMVELEMSWKQKPDFIMAFGTGGTNEKVIKGAYRLEIWESDLAAVAESEDAADLASLKLGAAVSGAGRVHLIAYIDQEKGRFLVYSAEGVRRADLKAAGRNMIIRSAMQVINTKGDLRIERLRVSRWNGEPPREPGADTSRLLRADGSTVVGEVTAFDPGSRRFQVRKEGEKDETAVPADEAAGLYLSPSKDERPWKVRLAAHDGTRLSGKVLKVEKGEVSLSAAGIEGTLRLPVSSLRSLNVHTPDDPPTLKSELMGTLELEGTRLRGVLADATARPDSGCLSWRTLASKTASPLRPDISGRIVYREQPSTLTTTVQRAPEPPRGIIRLFIGNNRQAAPTRPGPPPEPGSGRPSIHLRTGDVIPCEVTKIDETGVFFKSPLSDNTFVPHAKVKAVVLAPDGYGSIVLNRSKRERLLTLPRMQKESPPTHLVRSKNGDYLRGRLLNLTDKALQVEIRLETKDLPRERISRITWLHPDELSEAAKPGPEPKAGKPPEATTVQVVRSDGVRITFDADHFADSMLCGKSDVLGVCRVPVKEIDQLLIGRAIGEAASKLAQQQWKLRNALEPKAPPEDSGEPSSGTESALVGKPAPDFTLELLGSGTGSGNRKFHLADAKGKVVILDFWATWCGPCLQAMPQVEKAAEEFRDRGVQLIAVNLEEKPEQIRAMLERHKMHPTVALDVDGAVAGKYKAAAIPMTVVIGPDGNVARLFVGSSPHLGDQLREALKAVLDGPPAKAPAPGK